MGSTSVFRVAGLGFRVPSKGFVGFLSRACIAFRLRVAGFCSGFQRVDGGGINAGVYVQV